MPAWTRLCAGCLDAPLGLSFQQGMGGRCSKAGICKPEESAHHKAGRETGKVGASVLQV